MSKDMNYYDRVGYISNSSLSHLYKSPNEFRKAINGLLPQEDKSYFRFGQLVHLKILEPFEFDKTVLVYDYDIPKSAQQKSFIETLATNKSKSKDDEFIVSIYKDNYKTKESDEKILEKANSLVSTFESYFKYLKLKDVKTIISSKELEKINLMEQSCRNHKVAKELLFDLPHPLSKDGVESFNEFEILWGWDELNCKSLIDRHIVDYNTKTIKLIDFKTTGKLNKFEESFYNFSYDRQLVFYKQALLNNLADTIGLELKDWTFEQYIVACDTITHECKVFKITEDNLKSAVKELDDLMERAKYHITNNKWDYSMEYYLGDGYETLKTQ